MKYKNYKSAIHNFTHSFISIDYSKSGRLAVNILIELQKIGIESKTTFNFLSKTINPVNSDYKESRELMSDYLNWLPEHFKNHNCDFAKLEKLIVTIWADFERAFVPQRMNDTKELVIFAKTVWKAVGKDEEIIEINQTELVNQKYLQSKIPEIY